MGKSARNFSSMHAKANAVGESSIVGGSFEPGHKPAAGIGEDFVQTLPCVVYECSGSGQLTFISENVLALLGLDSRELLGGVTLWGDRVFPQDLELFRQKLKDLEQVKSVALIHRLINRWGMPVWVNHGLQKLSTDDGCLFRGCLLSVGEELTVRELGQGAVERFVHKLGNHFTLLRVVLGSLRRVLPVSRETDVLHETVDRAIELTRRFSEYNQRPSCWLESVNMVQVIEAALIRIQPMFMEKRVLLKDSPDPSLENSLVPGDPFLLELAIGHILQNALEATAEGNKVSVQAWAETTKGGAYTIVRVRVRDTGVGIEEENLSQVLAPFYSTKEGHEGLGLTMAHRFVEIHSGLLHLTSQIGKGTEVNITLPAGSKKRV